MTKSDLRQFVSATVVILLLVLTAFTITVAAQSREVRIANTDWDTATGAQPSGLDQR